MSDKETLAKEQKEESPLVAVILQDEIIMLFLSELKKVRKALQATAYACCDERADRWSSMPSYTHKYHKFRDLQGQNNLDTEENKE